MQMQDVNMILNFLVATLKSQKKEVKLILVVYLFNPTYSKYHFNL